MKYLTVFLVIVLLQLSLAGETMAQGSRTRINKMAPTLPTLEFSADLFYQNFWDKQSKGFFVGFDGEVLYFFNQAIGAGFFGSVAGGGGQYNDGSYNEPSTTWTAGIKSKLRTATSFYDVKVGYFQISRDGQIASGLADNVFSQGLKFGLGYETFGRHLLKEWLFTRLAINFEGKKAIKAETPAWQGNYFINYELLPEIITGTGKLTVIEIRPGKLMIPWGVTGAVSMYDFKANSKIFYDVGTFLGFSYADNEVAKISFNYQNGLSGIKNIRRCIIGVSLDLSFLLKINQDNTQITNPRRRTR